MGKASLKHVSVRVPWHDNGWNGRVCLDSRSNSPCLAIRRNARNRDDDFEQENCDRPFSALSKLPPCIAERGAFLSPEAILYRSVLDYSRYSKDHEHIEAAPLNIPAYGGTLTPFRWMLREFAWDIAAERNIEASAAHEPQEGRAPKLIVETAWVQQADNQRALLEAFAKDIEPAHSLVFFYARQTPLSDVAGRQIVAVAKLNTLGQVDEYPYEGGRAAGRIRSMVWERPFQHSLRPDPAEEGGWLGGVVLPYHRVLKHAETEDINPSDFIAEVPADGTEQFLYGSEHVTHGTAITALQSVRNALERTKQAFSGGPWDRYIDWIDGELSSLWSMHGFAPGLGSALSCVGGKFNGTLFAHALAAELDDNTEPWPAVEAIFAEEREPPAGAPQIKLMQRRRFADLKENDPEGYELLKLLSRFELTREQAKGIFEGDHLPSVFLRNPYRLYELTRNSGVPIGLATVDRSLYPPTSERPRPPYPASLQVDLDEPEDPLRLRAIVVDGLERAAAQGHTVLSLRHLVQELERSPLSTDVTLDEQVIRLCKDDFAEEALVTKEDDDWFVQLKRYREAGEVIRQHVRARLTEPSPTSIDWAALIQGEFGHVDPDDKDEQEARREKQAALVTLEQSRLAILTGPAGTGKTTLLKIFLNQAGLVGRDIQLLAPTGKARVRLGMQTGRPDQARTLAQFLLEHGRYDFDTGEHHFDLRGETAAVTTCVVDECSMLTEDQLAALLSALPINCRLVLVGDPQQLPPIGAGRPFVDIIEELRQNHQSAGLAELTVSRRQGASDKLVSALSLPDVQLANLFAGRSLPPGEDAVISHGATPEDSDRLRFLAWDTPTHLRDRIREVVESEIGPLDDDLERAVDRSLGAHENGGRLYFDPGAGSYAEAWQILSAHKNESSGSAEINRYFKALLRAQRLKDAQQRGGAWRVIKPRGNDLITYGDKVICLRNHQHRRYNPTDGSRAGYLANGEVGIVVGDASTERAPRWTQVEFASQPGESFSFADRDFKEEGSPFLELAYAVTVHKAQGSEFGTVILVLPAKSPILSRELLYTALTRQKERVWVLHQGPFNHFLRLTSSFFSETARRSTNLFGPPTMGLVAELGAGGQRSAWLADKLIHKTRRGDLVRSKSEVIIANALDELERAGLLRYSYEKELAGLGNTYRLPDFTIETSQGTWYWEHCGMLGKPEYDRRWGEKQDWYLAQGISERTANNPDGRLIVTEDAQNGGIDSAAIAALAGEIFRSD